MKNACKHSESAYGEAYGYQGSVAVRPYTHENRAAHGGVRFTETCSTCGAKRSVNTNGMHEETGPWSADAATRKLWADRELRRRGERLELALQACPPVRLRGKDGSGRVVVSLDEDGMIMAEASGHGEVTTTEAMLAALPNGWLDNAKQVRALVLELRSATTNL